MSDIKKIDEYVSGINPDIDEDPENAFDGGWDEFTWEARNGMEVPGVGTVTIIERFGGEGQGDEAWVVFEVNGRMYKKEGYYASFHGTDWDGDLYEVEQYEKTVTDYRRVNG